MFYWKENKRNSYISEFCKKWGLRHTKNYVYGFKSVRLDNYSAYNFQIKYLKNKTVIDKNCDCNIDEENSFGLSAWNTQKAKEYYPKGKIIRVKIHKKDIGCVLMNTGKIRCFKQKVL